MIQVEIITIGDELLIGQVIDTNSAWIAQELNKIGFDVIYKSTVGDNEADILDAFERAFSRVSVVLVTGGIGPTKDDITKKTLCRYFNTQLILDEDVLKNIESIFGRLNRPLNELTQNQAYVPEGSIVIQNKMGTAPATWFEKNGKVLVSMPGVPYEMKWIMENDVISRLKEYFNQSDSIIHRSFWVGDYSESMLAIHLETFENELPDTIKLAYLPTSGLIRLRLTGKHSDGVFLSGQINEQEANLLKLLGKSVIAVEDKPIEALLASLLEEKGLTMCTAESCTGGKIASLITSMPGSSHYFKGSAVTYSNEVKTDILKVDASDIEQQGAVSETVVRQMALGAKNIFHTDCSVATSGIAGPDGGSDEKPVGTVWIAACYQEQLVSQVFHFSNNRENNILRSANMALLMLYRLISS